MMISLCLLFDSLGHIMLVAGLECVICKQVMITTSRNPSSRLVQFAKVYLDEAQDELLKHYRLFLCRSRLELLRSCYAKPLYGAL
jgi:hypothetical protein